MNKLINWIIYSSENPENFSLTIKGALLTVLPVVVMLINQLGFSLDGANAEAFVLSIVTICTTMITLFGLIRKLVNTFKQKEVVAFVKDKKLSPGKVASKKKVK